MILVWQSWIFDYVYILFLRFFEGRENATDLRCQLGGEWGCTRKLILNMSQTSMKKWLTTQKNLDTSSPEMTIDRKTLLQLFLKILQFDKWFLEENCVLYKRHFVVMEVRAFVCVCVLNNVLTFTTTPFLILNSLTN